MAFCEFVVNQGWTAYHLPKRRRFKFHRGVASMTLVSRSLVFIVFGGKSHRRLLGVASFGSFGRGGKRGRPGLVFRSSPHIRNFMVGSFPAPLDVGSLDRARESLLRADDGFILRRLERRLSTRNPCKMFVIG